MAEQRRFLLRPSGCAAPAPAKATNLVLGPRKVTRTFMRRYRLRQKQQAQKQQEQQQGQARALLAAVAVQNREGEVEGAEATARPLDFYEAVGRCEGRAGAWSPLAPSPEDRGSPFGARW